MKITNKIFFLLLLFFFIGNADNVLAQRFKSFSGELTQYPGELEQLFGNNMTKEDEEFLEKFTMAWDTAVESNLFSELEKQKIIETSNVMLDRKARPKPNFYNYLQLLIAFKEYKVDEKGFNDWHTAYLDMLENKAAAISSMDRVVEQTLQLVVNQQVFTSYSTVWKAGSPQFEFLLEEGQLRTYFGNTKLTCYAKRDSIHLYNVRGAFDPLDSKFYCEYALVTWERAGYERDKVYAELEDFEISMKRTDYLADSVKYVNTYYFDEPLLGKLNDKVKRVDNPSQATYPRFDSYKADFYLEDLYENIDYQGGLSMQGAKTIGSGSQNQDAKIYLSHNDTLFLTAASKYFEFKKDRVDGLHSSVKIHIGQDSIFHPDLKFIYKVATKELELVKTSDFTSKGPYYNSYHKIDMNFERLYYIIGEPLIYFKMMTGSAEGKGTFESANYFNYADYIRMQRLDDYHPLYMLKKYASVAKSREFTAMDYAKFQRLPVNSVRHQLMELAIDGFIFYDAETDMVNIKDKLYTYLDASINKIDYDVISLNSIVKSPVENATFNLRNYDLAINGVPRIQLSDSQSVVLYPDKEQIIMKQNRDFQFDGIVEAGLLTFHGNNYFFDYDSFKINLQSIDHLDLRVKTGNDEFERAITENVESRIENITGELLIDVQDNKSGRESYPEYPIFISRERSRVYYDGKSTDDGIYGRDNFYFELEPFIIDSLDNFTKEGIAFVGKLNSGGIFPEIEDTLRLQADNSMGFVRKTDGNGMPVYGGKGTIYNDIILSNKGLQASGKLEYLTSTTYSELFQFYPDSMNTNSKEFNIARQTSGVEYPRVDSKDNYIHWEPNNDEFAIDQKTEPFKMINDKTSLEGNLNLRTTGLIGTGFMDLTTADLTSGNFSYKADIIDADTSDFNLKSLNATGIMVRTTNVKSHVDFRQRKGEFVSNDDFSMVEFPKNQYISFLDFFIWNMDQKELQMGAKKQPGDHTIELKAFDEEARGPKYISIHPKQDSLMFVSPLASYNYEFNIIKATKVPYIDVADARIIPDEGKVTIRQGAEMETLRDAKVIASRDSQFYHLHTAEIDISGKYEYEGKADYDYVDENDNVQIIHFEEVKVDTGLNTVARGEIIEPDSFMLSPYYYYQGEVRLYAWEEFLTFDGAVKINHFCDSLRSEWLVFESMINPDLIFIPVPYEPKDINMKNIQVGMMMVQDDSLHIYPAMFTRKFDYFDTRIDQAYGAMFYDHGTKEFRVASRDKLLDRQIPGNYHSFNRVTCDHYAEGQLDLGVDMGQVKLDPVGIANFNSDSNLLTMDVVLALDFMISEEAMSVMKLDFDSLTDVDGVDLTRTVYQKSVKEKVGIEKAKELNEQLSLYGEYEEMPKELTSTLVLNQLKLKWNQATRSYRNVDGKIGIGSIDGKQVNKLVDGYFEVTKKRSTEHFDIYLKVNNNLWYYFGYTRGVMQTLSSNNQYMNIIQELPPRKRKMKVDRKETPYIYMVSSASKFSKFISNFEREDVPDDEEEDNFNMDEDIEF